MSFEELGLSAPLVRAVATAGYTEPTPVQSQAIPPVISGRDLLGCSQTGTGKTAAFALPILHRLSEQRSETQPAAAATEAGASGEGAVREPRTRDGKPFDPRKKRQIRALILAPTRELAAQIGDCFQRYGQGSGLRGTVIFGGVSQFRQTRDLQRGVDIVVATPGRLLDLYQQGYVDLSKVEIAVLDEADHMLDMGFLPDVRRIMEKVPRQRQTLLFSATMPPAIRELTDQILVNPVQIRIAPEQPATERVEQGVYLVQKGDKPELLLHLIETRPAGSTLVFARTKHGADKIVDKLEKKGVSVEAIHGNKSQNARQRALEGFRSGEVQVLVATDIAARGIDVRGIQYVINYDCPETPETYVHRIGRTGRAGDSGNAVSFCSGEERGLMVAVERHLKTRLNVLRDGPVSLMLEEEARKQGGNSGQRSKRKPFRPGFNKGFNKRPGGDATGDRSSRPQASGPSAQPGRERRRDSRDDSRGGYPVRQGKDSGRPAERQRTGGPGFASGASPRAPRAAGARPGYGNKGSRPVRPGKSSPR